VRRRRSSNCCCCLRRRRGAVVARPGEKKPERLLVRGRVAAGEHQTKGTLLLRVAGQGWDHFVAELQASQMGEQKGLAEALEKLTLFLSSTGDGSISGAIIPRQEVIQKIDLLPTNIKLEGATNYLSWSRRARLVVDQKDLDGYLLGTVQEPGDKTSAEGKKWKTINSLLIGWLLNSVVPSIGRSMEGLSTAAEIWKTMST
jgi:hypothetical protein